MDAWCWECMKKFHIPSYVKNWFPLVCKYCGGMDCELYLEPTKPSGDNGGESGQKNTTGTST